MRHRRVFSFHLPLGFEGRSKFKFKMRMLCRTTCIMARRLRTFAVILASPVRGALLYVPDAHTVDSGFQNSSFERDHVDTTTAAAENRVQEDTLHSATYAQVGDVVSESRLQLCTGDLQWKFYAACCISIVIAIAGERSSVAGGQQA